MKKFLLVFTIAILTGLFGTNFDSAFAQTPNAPPPNFKVAFIGDQGLNGESEAVLQLIAIEDTDMVLHQGDFDYADNPTAWDNQINTFLPGIPYFASVGNHDVAQWPAYQQKLQDRLANIPGAVCTGDLGVKSSCHYQGLFFILSGVGTMGSGHESYIQNELAADNSVWSICSWHKNQNAMQVGSKSNEVGWGAYEACRQGGAIIATAHEHSYERTKTLISTQSQTVNPAWTNPNDVSVSEGSTFAFVSGLGGQSIRNQDRCTPTSYPYGCNGEWANIYTSNQGAQSGALFCEFNVDGQENKASCYFKNISGQTIDSFNITSFMGIEIPQEPPVAHNQSVSTFENNSIDITLSATDANGDPLTYSIISGPQNGSLSGAGQTQTYTPNPNYDGPDSFTFKANDGTDDSNIATVSITVNPIPISGIIDVRINSSTDDAEEPAGSAMYLTSTDLELVDDPTSNRPDQTVGLRFTDIEVPQGATITSAYIQFETDETDDVPASLTFRAQDSDDSSTFSSATNNITNRPTTSSSVSWNNISPWNTVNEKHNTPDISSLVQQVVDRPGWSIGNNIAFIITGDGERTAESYDGEPAAAPLLHVEFDNSLPNNSPIANDDFANVNEGDSVNIDLATNDSDSDGSIDITSISVVSDPSNGSVQINLDGTVDYTHDGSKTTSDSFTYTIDDNEGATSNVAIVDVTVNPINEIPSISIIFPVDGSLVTGKITIEALVTGLAEATVSFFIDGLPIGENISSPYQTSYHTKDLSAGDHQLRAEIDSTSYYDEITITKEGKGGGDSGGSGSLTEEECAAINATIDEKEATGKKVSNKLLSDQQTCIELYG